MDTLIIPNPNLLEKKKKIIQAQGMRKFQVISDFDKTLTKAFAKGEYVLSLIAYLRNKKYLTEEYAPKAFALYEQYHPIEISLTLPRKEKEKAMHTWWKTHFQLLIECGLDKDTLQRAAQEMFQEQDLLLREGTLPFLQILKEKRIPLVIMSASLGDLLKELLQQHESLSKNITIVSNFFNFDKKGKTLGVKNMIIHSLNKREIELKDHLTKERIKKKKNILLLGDALEDLEMVKGFKYENLITIGFLNEREDELLPVYRKYFDVIVLKDGTMNYVNDLLREILNIS